MKITGRAQSGFEAESPEGKKMLRAKIIFVNEAEGIMIIECPIDIQQHAVPIGTKEFICPVDGTLLIVS